MLHPLRACSYVPAAFLVLCNRLLSMVCAPRVIGPLQPPAYSMCTARCRLQQLPDSRAFVDQTKPLWNLDTAMLGLSRSNV